MKIHEIAQYLFQIGTIPFIALGLLHTLYSLADVIKPRKLTPRNDQVRQMMTETGMKITNRTTLWLAWLGFNISHGIGVLFFGLIFLLIALYDFKLIQSIKFLIPLAILMSASYFVLAIRFWFYIPAIGTGIGLICFTLSYLML